MPYALLPSVGIRLDVGNLLAVGWGEGPWALTALVKAIRLGVKAIRLWVVFIKIWLVSCLRSDYEPVPVPILKDKNSGINIDGS